MDKEKIKISQIEEHVNKSIKNKRAGNWVSGKGPSPSRVSNQDGVRLHKKILGDIRSMVSESRLSKKDKYHAH
jgi:hypothetical protein